MTSHEKHQRLENRCADFSWMDLCHAYHFRNEATQLGIEVVGYETATSIPAEYFVFQVVSVDPDDWSQNTLVTSIEVVPPQ